MASPLKVIVLPHDPVWKNEFARVKATLEQHLAQVPFRSIEHVGSTSVAGLPAKPVIDIAIIVEEQHLESARQAMTAAGYIDLGELGVPGRWAFRQPGYGRFDTAYGTTSADKEMRRNTYVEIDGCQSLRNHLDVKRVLHEDNALRQEYGDVKLALAAQGISDVDEYCRAKTEVLVKILKSAGWSDEELAPIIEANK
jgi:GrpB-like predicted nucleotidyltransferase (UPF0157 family)